VGARTPAQVDGWIQAASLKLSIADLQEITSALERTKAGAGPTHPMVATATSKGRSA